MSFIDCLLSAVLMPIIFMIGSSPRFADLENMFRRSKPFHLRLSLQMTFLPTHTFIIAIVVDLSPAGKIGLIIVAICPGGATSNFISHLIKIDTVLAMALTSINSLLVLVSVPVLSNWTVAAFMEGHTEVLLPTLNTVWGVTKIIIIPATLGLFSSRYFPNITHRIRFPLKVINTLLLGVAFLIRLFAGEESGGSGISVDEIIHLSPTTSLMRLSSMILNYFVALKLFRLSGIQSATISIEVGLQNIALAIFVAGTLMYNVPMTRSVLVYAMSSLFTTLTFTFITIRIRKD